MFLGGWNLALPVTGDNCKKFPEVIIETLLNGNGFPFVSCRVGFKHSLKVHFSVVEISL